MISCATLEYILSIAKHVHFLSVYLSRFAFIGITFDIIRRPTCFDVSLPSDVKFIVCDLPIPTILEVVEILISTNKIDTQPYRTRTNETFHMNLSHTGVRVKRKLVLLLIHRLYRDNLIGLWGNFFLKIFE